VGVVFTILNGLLRGVNLKISAFGMKRVALRGAVMLAAIFVAESIPTFGPMLDLIGGSTLTLLNLIFPCLFYLYLKAQSGEHDGKIAVVDVKQRPPAINVWSVDEAPSDTVTKRPRGETALEWPDNWVEAASGIGSEVGRKSLGYYTKE